MKQLADYQEIKDLIMPVSIIKAHGVEGEKNLLTLNSDVSTLVCHNPCILKPNGFVLLDFGMEYQGGVKIITHDLQGKKNAKVRIRFGESAMECCAEIGEKGCTNDHSIRDEAISVPWMGCLEYGMTGYRFIRIDNVDDVAITLVQILGIFAHSGKQMRGKFECSDKRVNDVWQASARTLYLNNNKYITDGIKRDRLVWIGDMHPETMGILQLFGDDNSIRRSLDFVRDITPLPGWMNDLPAYSMWWIKIQHDLYTYTGNLEYLKEQLPYMKGLLKQLLDCINEDGSNNIENKFIDWPSNDDICAKDLGLHSLLIVALNALNSIFKATGEKCCDKISGAISALMAHKAQNTNNKQANALAVLAGYKDAKTCEEQVFAINGVKGVSAFLGYYVLQGRANGGNMVGALDIIRNYYGAMIDLGATTMWEDFNADWVKGGKKLDAILSPGEYDIHGDNGGYCYQGFRHSLCHGWSCGTVPFAMQYILGVNVAEAGCKKLVISPNLGDLEWANGTFPTSFGDVNIRCKNNNGKLTVECDAPKQIEIILNI